MDGQFSIPLEVVIFLFDVFFGETLGTNQPQSNINRFPWIRWLGGDIFHSPLSGGEVDIAYASYTFQYTS